MSNILEALQNAQINLKANNHFQRVIGLMQLDNAVAMIDKGYPTETDIDETLAVHDVEKADELPEFDE